MNFTQAIDLIKKTSGTMIVRASWNGAKYLKLVEGKIYRFRGVENEFGYKYFPEADDTAADDWETIEPDCEKGEAGERRNRHLQTRLARQRDLDRIRHKEHRVPTEDDEDKIDRKYGYQMKRKKQNGKPTEYLYCACEDTENCEHKETSE